jgi:hypothetical protein
MTLYRLYLRSNVRREPLAPRDVPREAGRSARSPAGREEHPSMIGFGHRYSYAISGSEAFEAENDAAALAIARTIFDAATDLCDAFELWDGTRHIDQSCVTTLPVRTVVARHQDDVIQTEELLLSSDWAIARSSRLLARFDALREEAPIDPVSPAAAPRY